jgi:hypothetical protein
MLPRTFEIFPDPEKRESDRSFLGSGSRPVSALGDLRLLELDPLTRLRLVSPS